MHKKLLYLSGAPRVSTSLNAQMGGPKAHILGIVGAFKKKGWETEEFIYGNKFERQFRSKESDKQLKSNLGFRLLADFYRIYIGFKNQINISKKYKNRHERLIIYERLAAFQHLGKSLKRKSSSLWLVEVNGLLFLEGKKDRKGIFLSSLCRYFEGSTYKSCDHIITVSDELKNLILHNFKSIDPKKIMVIPNGVDIDRFNPLKYNFVREFSDFTIGFVGTLIEWCGIGILIEALAELPIDSRPNLVIIGDGIARSSFEEKTKNLGLNHKIKFLGQQCWDDIPSFIGGFDVCYSGQIETKSGKMYHSPLKIYEYLAMGKPVIASSFADASNVIEHEINGFLFSPGDKDELKNAILTCMRQHELKGFQVDLIRNKIIQNHSWSHRVDLIIDNLSTEEN